MQCEELVQEGATAGKSPAAVVAQCPITFAMLAQDDVALEVSFELNTFRRAVRKLRTSVHIGKLGCFAMLGVQTCELSISGAWTVQV